MKDSELSGSLNEMSVGFAAGHWVPLPDGISGTPRLSIAPSHSISPTSPPFPSTSPFPPPTPTTWPPFLPNLSYLKIGSAYLDSDGESESDSSDGYEPPRPALGPNLSSDLLVLLRSIRLNRDPTLQALAGVPLGEAPWMVDPGPEHRLEAIELDVEVDELVLPHLRLEVGRLIICRREQGWQAWGDKDGGGLM